MFASARIKLTAWYLMIIMIISFLFSITIFANVNSDLVRIEERQRRMLDRQRVAHEFFKRMEDRGVIVPPMSDQPLQNLEIIAEARSRFIFVLAFINLGIFGLSGIAGYFLAGRTLKPIQDMVIEQRRFINDASHELRTPLTALRSELEVDLLDKKLTLRGARATLKSNLEEVKRLQLLSENLLELAQLEKARKLTFTSLQIATVIAHAAKKLHGIAKQKNIAFRISIPGHVYVKGDSSDLERLFVILLDNAVKYSPKGSFITVTAIEEAQYNRISVIDRGAGISREALPYIFDRFYRADASRATTEASGYGLGLAIAKKIVDQHKGKIAVDSKKGKGTTFIIHLLRAS